MRNSMLKVVRVAAAVAALAGLSSVARAQGPAPAPFPAASQVKSAVEAAALLRELHMIQDFNDGAALGDVFVKRFPRDTRVRAWYVANLARSGSTVAADSLTAGTDTLSRDPWVLAGRVFSQLNSPVQSRAAIAAAARLARRARSFAPKDADLAVLCVRTSQGAFTDNNYAEMLALVDSVAPTVGNPAELLVLRANALFGLSSPPRMSIESINAPPDSAKRAMAWRAYAAARAADTTNFDAMFDMAARLRNTKDDESLALLKLAVARSPRATNVRSFYWSTINAQRGIPPSQKQATIAADRMQFLAVTDSAPWALATVIGSMRYPTPEPGMAALEERVLAKAPRSRWAEDVLLRRASQWNDSLYAARDTTRPGPKSDTVIVRKRYIEAMEAFINTPWIANAVTRDQAALSLLFAVREDSTYPADKLVALVRQVTTGRITAHPAVTYGYGARALADRKIEFRLAEQLARAAAKDVVKYLDDFPGFTFSSVGDKADALDSEQAQEYDNLGWVFYNEGRYADADKEISRAIDLTKKNVNIFYDLGRLRTAQGRYEEAELTFAQGMTIRYRGVNPNRKQLEQLYAKNHGSMDGWPAYVSALEEKERTTRREKILATREKTDKLATSFRLPDLEGHIVASDSLRGRYTVVNFWGTWCGPCVAEMPELQQFYDKYRTDPAVDILTISNDKDLQELKDWMAKRRLSIPTLFDDGWVAGSAQIRAWPTTWFIDRDGKLQFSAIGNTGSLVEEWSWRLEAMRTKAVAVP